MQTSSLLWVNIKYIYEFNKPPQPDAAGVVAPLPEFLRNEVHYIFHQMYFVMTTISTNGYGDILPDKKSPRELLYSMLVMSIGLICMTSVISMSNAVFASFEEIDKKRKEKVKDFQFWFRALERASKAEFSNEFVASLDSFFRFLYTADHHNLLYNNSFFEFLPATFASELAVACTLGKKSIMHKLIARKYSALLCVAVSKELQPNSYFKGDLILPRSTEPSGVYWVAKGCVSAVYTKEKVELHQFKFGDYFGEFGLFQKRCIVDFVATEDTVLLFIAKEVLAEILQRFFVENDDFIRRANKDFCDLMTKKNAVKTIKIFGSPDSRREKRPSRPKQPSTGTADPLKLDRYPQELQRSAEFAVIYYTSADLDSTAVEEAHPSADPELRSSLRLS